MADPWLVHEVLGELDQVGACYFALTLQMAHLSTYLVGAHKLRSFYNV